MPRFNIIRKMEVAMRFIYGHFLEEDETLPEFMESREGVRPKLRHVVRFIMYNQFHCSYDQISRAENTFDGLGEKRDPSTISHSISYVNNLMNEKSTRAYDEIIDLFHQSMDYWEEFKSPKLINDIQRLYEMPHHVLPVIVGTALQNGYFDRTKFNGLYTEFSTVGEYWFKEEILMKGEKAKVKSEKVEIA